MIYDCNGGYQVKEKEVTGYKEQENADPYDW
jgi:hypothetical protein